MAQEAEVNAAMIAGPVDNGGFAGWPVDEHIELADIGAFARGAVQLAAGGKDAVADALGIELAAAVPGEPLVIRIGPHLRGGELAVQLIGATEHDGADEFLEGPAFVHEPLREVIKQFWMRRAGTVHAEIIRGGDQPAPEEMQPHTVGHHARG